MEPGFTSLSCPLWPGRGLSVLRIDGREVFALLRATWRIASGKPRINIDQRWSGREECMSSLVKITNLEGWRGDVRGRQRRWVLKEKASIGISRIVVGSVVFSNSNEHTSGRQGWDSAYEGRGRGGDRFSLDRLNLGSSGLLAGRWGLGGGGMRGRGVERGTTTVHHIAFSPHGLDCGFIVGGLPSALKVSLAGPQKDRI